MKKASIGDFLTAEDTERVKALFEKHPRDASKFVEAVEREVIQPNMDRINAVLGQENNARYLAYAVAAAFLHVVNDDAAPIMPGAAPDLWEWAEDRCQVCNELLGHGLRFMHLGLCDNCAKAPKH